ncbi:energy transducer TonB [Vibrio rotiferianus]|uniref:energy transducer TonB n=1 Tax=Vibrio rotiferianus TaxID=190895 RepID=UPI000B59A7A5|nr:energy transducer TonB [Vibrio rotiferianus]ASI93911.1 energy transducer TonB [Vibrio rotiferianus]
MNILKALLLSLITLIGCSSSPKVHLTQSPIEVESQDLDKYWVQDSGKFKFTSRAKLPKTSGYVLINYLVDSNGEIFNPTIVESSPKGEWELIALEALSRINYLPSKSNSAKIPVYVTSEFKFLDQ